MTSGMSTDAYKTICPQLVSVYRRAGISNTSHGYDIIIAMNVYYIE